VVKADAPGIAYAVERDWLIISGGFHSVSLTRGRPAPGEVAAAPFAGVADSPATFSPEAIYPFL
jgi:hypothetical protein